MSSDRPIFLRPIEHIQDDSHTDFTIGSNSYAIDSGTYANVYTLLLAVGLEADEITDIRISPTSDGHCSVYSSYSGNITWTNTTLRDALGFSGATTALTSSAWTDAPYLSKYVWLPEHAPADQGCFYQSHKEQWFGSRSLTGKIAGVGFSDGCYFRDVTFNAELGTNLGVELCESAEQAARCLDAFFIASISSVPLVASHSGTKGFYFYQHYSSAVSECSISASDFGDGGVEFSKTSSPDTYVFCNFLEKSDWHKNAFFTRGRQRYNVSLSFCTAPAGSWV